MTAAVVSKESTLIKTIKFQVTRENASRTTCQTDFQPVELNFSFECSSTGRCQSQIWQFRNLWQMRLTVATTVAVPVSVNVSYFALNRGGN